MKNYAANAQQRTFQKTLSRITLLNLMSAMVVAWFLLSLTAMVTLKEYEQQNLNLQAMTLSHNLEAAIVFNDKQAVDEVLAKFGQEGMFSHAQVQDYQENTISNWQSDDSKNAWLLHIPWLHSETVSRPVFHNKDKVGEVQITGSGYLLSHFLSQSLVVLTLCLLLIFAMSYLLARHLHNDLVSALQAITDVVHDVRKNRNFGRRITSERIRGLHLFADDFNKLLDEIEQWQIQLHRENASLWKSARHDELTALPNRSVFRDAIQEVMDKKAQHPHTALLFMDGNKFKLINDTFGHSAGDMVLVETARRLEQFAGNQHLAFRLNGDEFAMLLNDVSSPEEIEKIVNCLQLLMAKPIAINNGDQVFFSLSIGYAMTADVSSAKELFELADSHMYSKKPK